MGKIAKEIEIETETETENDKKLTPYQKVALIGISLVLICCFFTSYSRYIATTTIEVREIKIVNKNLPADYHGFKIAHLSDIHYNTTIRKDQLNEIVEKVNQLKPDLVVLTGDLLDKRTTYSEQDFTDLTETLAKIDPVIGKYAVTGNHDVTFTEWETIIKNSGFINFNDQYDLLYKDSYDPILLAGSSSNLNDKKKIQDKLKPTIDYMNSVKKNTDGAYQYAILLLHEPDMIQQIDYEKFDLVLAGHSHQGQIRIPFFGAIITPKGAKTYYEEHYNIDGTELYISNGLGTSKYPYRLFNRPSIYFYRLQNN